MKHKQQYELTKGQTLSVAACAGNVIVRGWDAETVEIKGVDVNVTQQDDGLVVSANSDLKIQVPAGIIMTFGTVNGNLRIKGVDGDIRFETVNGNLVASRAGLVEGDQVDGNLKVTHLSGSCHVNTVHGQVVGRQIEVLTANQVMGGVEVRNAKGGVNLDAIYGRLSLRGVDGPVHVDTVMGEADLRYLSGPIHLEQVNGDAQLRGALSETEKKNVINAAGNIILRWPPNEPVQLLVTADGDIRNKLEGVQYYEMENGESSQLSASVGEGGPTLVLASDGDVVLKTLTGSDQEYAYYYDFDGDDFSVDIELEMDELGEKMGQQFEMLGKKLETRFGPDFSATISRKIESAIDQAAAKIEQVQMRSWRSVPTPPKPPSPSPAPSPSPVGQQESSAEGDITQQQLRILEMLERGDISVEDANMLLKALE